MDDISQKKKAVYALNNFLKKGNCIKSDRIIREKGTGTIRTIRNRYNVMYRKNKKAFSKTFDTPEECEEWLKQEFKF